MRKYITKDGKIIISFKEGLIVWRMYFKKIKKHPTTEEISNEDYLTSMKALITILKGEGEIILNSRTQYDKEIYIEEYSCIGDLKYSLTVAKEQKSCYIIFNLAKGIKTTSEELYQNKSKIIDFINKHFNYEMPDT